MPSLHGANGWLNSQPLMPAGLRGKVVLVNFWTYTCVNWLRTLPYVRAWSEKYKDRGLVVIGVHTPEFPFEKNIDNVRRAAKAMRIGYPIAIDSDSVIWRAFHNDYWPALYFVDAQGGIRHHEFGEGRYDQSEMIIQALLRDAGATRIGDELVSPDTRGPEVAADWATLKSPENYTGYRQAEGFASPGGASYDKAQSYSVPPQLPLNHWALSGDWTITARTAVPNHAGGTLAYRFHARDLNCVIAPGQSPARIRVRIDGQPPGASHGSDADELGNATFTEQRTYQLLRQQSPITDRTCTIEFLDPGVEVYCFTFG
jgi:thiol-disulfide isomerase/thioredoxin